MRQWLVDAFSTGRPFTGNPAAVVEPLDAWPDAAFMQALARENAQSETAFMVRGSEPGRYGLRWFTPALEVPLCGHATLAAAHVLFSALEVAAPEIVFDTASGPLRVRRLPDGRLDMDFPAQPPKPAAIPDGLSAALGAPVEEVWAGPYLVALLANATQVRGLSPDIAALERIAAAATGGRGNLVVAALSDPGSPHDVTSRFFAPGSGVAEDPATGSAHCILAPLFAARLGRAQLAFHQAFPGRGADIACTLAGDRVRLAGAAVTILEGRLLIGFA